LRLIKDNCIAICLYATVPGEREQRAVADEEKSELQIIAERFLKHVKKNGEDECWLWTGFLERSGSGAGYGKFQMGTKRSMWAHRAAYELFVGPIPPGHVVDHVRKRNCHNRACVNPRHLEAVTQQVNTLRGLGNSAINAKKTHCRVGHPYDEANTYFGKSKRDRRCKICQIEKAKQRYWRNKAAREKGKTPSSADQHSSERNEDSEKMRSRARPPTSVRVSDDPPGAANLGRAYCRPA
jgi:hypothetical protein